MQLEFETLLGKTGYRMPIGILGGSFNPPHLGHVHISIVSLRSFGLGQIYWVFAKQNPLKKFSPSSCGERFKKTKKLVKSPNIKFSQIKRIKLKNNDLRGIIFDLGYSLNQIKNSKKGLSFNDKGKLNMRMGINDFSANDFISVSYTHLRAHETR